MHTPLLLHSVTRRKSSSHNNKTQAIRTSSCYWVTSWAILVPHTQTREAQVLWGIQRDSNRKYVTGCDSWDNNGSRVQRGTRWMWPTDSNEPLWVCLLRACGLSNQLPSQSGEEAPQLPPGACRHWPRGLCWRRRDGRPQRPRTTGILRARTGFCCFHPGLRPQKALLPS